MVIDDDLKVLGSLDLCPRTIISGVGIRVNVNNFSISLVLEQQAGLVVRDHLEVGRGVGGRGLGLPVVVAQVAGLGHELLPPLKVRLEVLRLQPQGVVDVAGDFLSFRILVSYEDYCRELAVADELLAVGEGQEDGAVGEVLAGRGQLFGHVCLLRTPLSYGLLPRLELLPLERVAAPTVSQLHELPRQVLALQVEHVRVGDLRVEVIFIGCVGFHRVAANILHL
mmetsp:Transcript_12412/g.22596  ORF Transcript_12412/g.22596 Transcript_12412/m.22596 type:complete len:225 (+) Transcript_12412:100-774(+)